MGAGTEFIILKVLLTVFLFGELLLKYTMPVCYAKQLLVLGDSTVTVSSSSQCNNLETLVYSYPPHSFVKNEFGPNQQYGMDADKIHYFLPLCAPRNRLDCIHNFSTNCPELCLELAVQIILSMVCLPRYYITFKPFGFIQIFDMFVLVTSGVQEK